VKSVLKIVFNKKQLLFIELSIVKEINRVVGALQEFQAEETVLYKGFGFLKTQSAQFHRDSIRCFGNSRRKMYR